MELNVLGPVTVTSGSELLSIGGPKQRTVLAMLISRAGQSLTADVLARAVYGDQPPDRSRRLIQTYVSTLRSELGDVIAKDGAGWSLAVDRARVDATRFHDQCEAAAHLTPEQRATALRDALSIWRGEPYADVEAHGELDSEITRLSELRLVAYHARIEADLESGRHEEVIGELEALVREWPFQERFRAQHMLALYRAGRQREALRSYGQLRELLVDELGVDPSPDLQRLERRILDHDDSLRQPPTHTSPVVRNPEHVGAEPTGVVTFLFTDVEGSTRLWAADPPAMSASLRVHDEVLRRVIEAHGGYVFTTAGDAFCVAFARASAAVECALEAQAELGSVAWPGPTLRVRMGLHLGEAESRGGDYFGPTLNTAARVQSAGHGGQVLLTESVRSAAGVSAVDLGVHELRDVAEPVHLHQLGEGEFGPLRVVPRNLSTLPIPATSLFGREDEIRLVRSLLLEHRLVTITGVGGSGKTRLAIEVAERELARLAHGAYFADLSSVSSDEGVVDAVAEALRLHLGSGKALSEVLDHLADKQVLVVLDNCEHVIDACADFAQAALARPGDWRLVATSREHLDVEGERVVQVPALQSESGGAAVRLFADRAAAVRPTFVVDDSNRRAVTELCERLDGMPLAIELAAARVSVMSPAELLERLDDRFRLLSGGRRRTRQRQRTLEATLDWSYQLLDEREQHFLNGLGVMVGRFDAALAAAIADVDLDEGLDILTSLVAKSLVVTDPGAERTLFRLLETVRIYAQDHLLRAGEVERARDRHLQHHLDAVSETATEAAASYGSEDVWDWTTVRRWLEVSPNLEAAIDWAIATDRHADAGELLISTHRVARERLNAHATLDRIDLVKAALPGSSAVLDRLIPCEMDLAMAVDDPRRRRLAEAAAESENPVVREYSLVARANLTAMVDPAESLRLTHEAERLHQESSPARVIGFWDKNRADIHMFAGEYQEAIDLLRPHQGRHLFVVIDPTIAVALLLDGRPEEALQIVTDHPMKDSIWMSFGVIAGLSHLALGDLEAGRRELIGEARSAALGRIRLGSNSALVGLAALLHHTGESAWAADIILQAGCQREVTIQCLARAVADEIGVRDDFVAQQEAALTSGKLPDRTDLLRDTLAHLDAQAGR